MKAQSQLNESVLAFCIYADTAEGSLPVRRTPTGFPLVCPTREAAEREIAETIMERMRLFLSAEATLEEAMEMGEYIVDVTVLPDGSVVDESDNYFPVINPQQKV